MTIPPIDLNAIMLAVQVTKILNVIHRVAYALISPDLRVLYASPNFTTVVSEPTTNIFGRPIEELIWEFVGAEKSLKAIINGTMPFLAFERVNREMADGRLLYLDINDFLDLDLVEQGALSLRPEENNLNDIVEQVVNMLAYLAEKRQQKLSLHLWPDGVVFAFDENRLQQILYNLISNAIKYTRQNGKIVVSTRVEGETAVIQITDNGQGMTEEQQAAAFDLYYRTDDADSYDITGRGLGLYIVRMLTKAHGGHVDLTSKPDQGSTFRVYLPMQPAMPGKLFETY